MPGPKKKTSYIASDLNFDKPDVLVQNILLHHNDLHIAIKKDDVLLGLEKYDADDKSDYFDAGMDLYHVESLRHDFKEQSFFLHAPSTLIPAKSFHEEELDAYIHFNFGAVSKAYKACYDDISIIDAKLVYSLPESLLNNIHKYFPKAAVGHILPRLLSIYAPKASENNAHIFLDIGMQKFDVLVFDNQKFIFTNTFNYGTAQDFIYFLMFVIKQLNLNPDTLYITLGGYIDREGSIFKYIHKYIRHVDFVSTDKIKKAAELDHLPIHYNYNIIA